MSDGIDALEAMVARLTNENDCLTADNARLTDEMVKLEMVKFWEGITRLRKFFRLAEYTPPANIALEAIEVVERITAENARLRAEVEQIKEHAAGHAAECADLMFYRLRQEQTIDALREEVEAYKAQWEAEVAGKLALRRECGAMDDETWPEFLARVTGELDAARANARILAHAHEHDSRPPRAVIDESLAYPVATRPARRTGT